VTMPMPTPHTHKISVVRLFGLCPPSQLRRNGQRLLFTWITIRLVGAASLRMATSGREKMSTAERNRQKQLKRIRQPAPPPLRGDFMLSLPPAWAPLAKLSHADVAKRTTFVAHLPHSNVTVVGVEQSQTDRIRAELIEKHPTESRSILNMMVYVEERKLEEAAKAEQDAFKQRLTERKRRQHQKRMNAITLPKFLDADGKQVPIASPTVRTWLLENRPQVYHQYTAMLREAQRVQQQETTLRTAQAEDARLAARAERVAEKDAKREEAMQTWREEREATQREKAEAERAHMQTLCERNDERVQQRHDLSLQVMAEREQRVAQQLTRFEEERDAELSSRRERNRAKERAAQERLAEEEYEASAAEHAKHEQRVAQAERAEAARAMHNASLSARARDAVQAAEVSASQRRETVRESRLERRADAIKRLQKQEEQLDTFFDEQNKQHAQYCQQNVERLDKVDDRYNDILMTSATQKRETVRNSEQQIEEHRERRGRYVVASRQLLASTARGDRPEPSSDGDQQQQLCSSGGAATSRPSTMRRRDESPLTALPQSARTAPSPDHSKQVRQNAAAGEQDLRQRQQRLVTEMYEKQAALEERRAEQDTARMAKANVREKQWEERRVYAMEKHEARQAALEAKNAKLMQPPAPKSSMQPSTLARWSPKEVNPFTKPTPPASIPFSTPRPAAIKATDRGTAQARQTSPPMSIQSGTARRVSPSHGSPCTMSASELIDFNNATRTDDLGAASQFLASSVFSASSPDERVRQAQTKATQLAEQAAAKRRGELEQNEARLQAGGERRLVDGGERDKQRRTRNEQRLAVHHDRATNILASNLQRANERLERQTADVEVASLRRDDLLQERTQRAATERESKLAASRQLRSQKQQAWDSTLQQGATRQKLVMVIAPAPSERAESPASQNEHSTTVSRESPRGSSSPRQSPDRSPVIL
jgi:hypothetical protein